MDRWALDSVTAHLNSAAMRLLAPAKINLHLRVGQPRPDGFHPLVSWMTTVGLFDNLILEKTVPADQGMFRREGAGRGEVANGPLGAGASAAAVVLECDLPGLPCDEGNLVVKIALALREALRSSRENQHTGRGGDQPDRSTGAATPREGVWARLQKHIPIGAGLGGGSSDAARTLMGLNQLWGMGWAADALSAFAARFGSDLSFFVHGPSSVCRGRGEIVEPIPAPAARWAVLMLPRLSMPTPQVYRRFDQMRLGREEDLSREPNWREWTKLTSRDLLAHLVNDLEPAAFDIAPALGELRLRMEDIANRPVRMSGSGSSLFTLYDFETEAREAAIHIEKNTGERALAAEVSPVVPDDLNTDFANQ